MTEKLNVKYHPMSDLQKISDLIVIGNQFLNNVLTPDQRQWTKDILPILEAVRIILLKMSVGEPFTREDRQIIELLRSQETNDD